MRKTGSGSRERWQPIAVASDAARLVAALDAAQARVAEAQREVLSLIAQVDRHDAWEGSGARDTAHWLSMRYDISGWKAARWIGAAHALAELPAISASFSAGELGIDKVVELCRFATPQTEAPLLRWASDVSNAAVRRRGDIAHRAPEAEVIETERARTLSWWHEDEGRRIGLHAELPAAQGAVVVRAIERMAEQVPAMPDETGPWHASARQADALVAICSATIADNPDPDRATVLVHARTEDLARHGGCEVQGGPVIHPESLERLLCTARVQTVVEDEHGSVLGLGRLSREPSAWMMRQVRYRDRGCRFPGCGTRAFTQAHHIVWWSKGGLTDLENLVLICSFHHRLVHEHGWSIERQPDGVVRWSYPDGTRYRAGPTPLAASDRIEPPLLDDTG